MTNDQPSDGPITPAERVAEMRRLCSGMGMAMLVGIAVFVTSSVGDITGVSGFLAAIGAAAVTTFCWALFLYGVRGIWWKIEDAKNPTAADDA